MTGLVRYLLADVLRSQRYLAPLLLFAAVLGMLNAGDAGPPLPAYAGTCVLVYPVAIWLTIVVATAEDPVRRAVTVTAAGGWGRTQAAVALLASLAAGVVALVAALVPVVSQPHPYPPATVAAGFAGLLVSGLTGVAVGLVCARPVIQRPGWSVLVATASLVLVFKSGQVPPLGNVLGALARQDGLAPALAVSGACAAALVVAATLLARTLGPRRG